MRKSCVTDSACLCRDLKTRVDAQPSPAASLGLPASPERLCGGSPMPKMPVMEAAVKILESEGVEVAFGIPGAAILPLYKALSKSTKIKHLTMRHEEGATHAADGWARITGKVGVAIGTSGPAGTNMVTGPLHLHGRFHPHRLHHRPGVEGQPAQGGVPGGEHRRDRQARHQEELLRHGDRPDPAGLSRGLPDRPRGTARSGADRPAARRPAGRGRVRSRHRRAPRGLQALPGCPQDPAGRWRCCSRPSGRS